MGFRHNLSYQILPSFLCCPTTAVPAGAAPRRERMSQPGWSQGWKMKFLFLLPSHVLPQHFPVGKQQLRRRFTFYRVFKIRGLIVFKELEALRWTALWGLEPTFWSSSVPADSLILGRAEFLPCCTVWGSIPTSFTHFAGDFVADNVDCARKPFSHVW